MTATLTPRERELARHALGLNADNKVSWRNFSAVDVDHPWAEECRSLTGKGFATCERVKNNIYFRLTRAGAEAALEAGETLDEEDFPR